MKERHISTKKRTTIRKKRMKTREHKAPWWMDKGTRTKDQKIKSITKQQQHIKTIWNRFTALYKEGDKNDEENKHEDSATEIVENKKCAKKQQQEKKHNINRIALNEMQEEIQCCTKSLAENNNSNEDALEAIKNNEVHKKVLSALLHKS